MLPRIIALSLLSLAVAAAVRADDNNGPPRKEREAVAPAPNASQDPGERTPRDNPPSHNRPGQPGDNPSDSDGPRPRFQRFIRLEKGAFLGVTTSPVNPPLREQLNLAKGVGLIVDFVAPSSPADAAGLKRFDIIEKINEQLLVNPEQLATLIRMQKPGDSVSLAIIHGGQRSNVTAKLIEKDLPPLDDHPMGPPGGGPFGPEFGIQGFAGSTGGISVMVDEKGNTTRTVSDDKMTVTLTTGGKEKHCTAKDSTGKQLFDGAVDTDEQRKAVPAEVASRLKNLESGQLERMIPDGPDGMRPPPPPRHRPGGAGRQGPSDRDGNDGPPGGGPGADRRPPRPDQGDDNNDGPPPNLHAGPPRRGAPQGQDGGDQQHAQFRPPPPNNRNGGDDCPPPPVDN